MANGEIGAFYEFYASRCPKGLVHEWAGGRCAKCGLNITVLEGANTALESNATREYYSRFSAQFAEERRSAREAQSNDNLPDSAPDSDAKSSADKEVARMNLEADEWKPNYTLVVDAANLAGVPPTLIEAIGQTDGREYADVVDGRGVPAPPTSPADPRIFAVDAEIRMFLADYNTLRAAGKIRKIPLPIAELINATGVPKHELAALQLPEVGADYYDRFAAIVRRRNGADIYAFAIQSLCAMALKVASATGVHEWVGRLGAAFAKQELLLILRGQKLFAKPGPFNWAIFETEDDGDALAAADQVGDVGEDIVMDENAEEDNPYSGDALDYDPGELGPNDEPP
jgi:hypothetical protein